MSILYEKCEPIEKFGDKEAVFIDAMNTVFVPRHGRWELYKVLIKKFSGLSLKVNDIERIYKMKRKESEQIKPSTNNKLPKGSYGKYWGEINGNIINHFDPKFENSQKIGVKIYNEIMGNPEYYVVQPEVVDFLRDVGERGMKVFLVSNQETDNLNRIISKFEISYLINGGVISSDDIGYKKPDIRFFNEALKLTEISSDKIAFVGNNPKNDMEGAAKAGINYRILYDPAKEHVDTRCEADFIRVVSLRKITRYSLEH